MPVFAHLDLGESVAKNQPQNFANALWHLVQHTD